MQKLKEEKSASWKRKCPILEAMAMKREEPDYTVKKSSSDDDLRHYPAGDRCCRWCVVVSVATGT